MASVAAQIASTVLAVISLFVGLGAISKLEFWQMKIYQKFVSLKLW